MQFVANGPDVPDALLQAQEEGRLVFFCGSGISYPAGLPDFAGLVEKVYSLIGTARDDLEKNAIARHQFDLTLDLLSRRLLDGRTEVKKAVARALRRNRWPKDASANHEALLQLAQCRSGELRLVTTNFDHLFERAAKRNKQTFERFLAPTLPIPKMGRWSGLVYLHGLIPKINEDSELNRLIITSGDFGLAYLTERWAARFVSEMFRNFVVCFVGYSINDPVLRYMMDALAADRSSGMPSERAWAFGNSNMGSQETGLIEWKSKGVIPILYNCPTEKDHSLLCKTLRVWAETFRDGVLGKERIVVNHALAHPSGSTKEDDFIGRMLWALSDESGLPAKRFAEFRPAPPLDWLIHAFSKDHFQRENLTRFGVAVDPESGEDLPFAMVRRPAPYTHAPAMSLASGGSAETKWDKVMGNLACWLDNHLNDHRLVLWVVEQGGNICQQWRTRIERSIYSHSAQSSHTGAAGGSGTLGGESPIIISPSMRKLWQLMLSGCVKTASDGGGLFRWIRLFEIDGLTLCTRHQLRRALAPKLALKPAWWAELKGELTAESAGSHDLIECELVLAEENAEELLLDTSSSFVKSVEWATALPLLFEDLQMLLRDGLDLLREVDRAGDRFDGSQRYVRSIKRHPQNRHGAALGTLIWLLRDSWLKVRETDPGRAIEAARNWWLAPYPAFKRLALFAASFDGVGNQLTWVDWLLSDGGWWLWRIETMRESLRLLVEGGRFLPEPELRRLEAAILAGPPREIYDPDLEPALWEQARERSIWLRLAKLSVGGVALGEVAAVQLRVLSKDHPEWKVAGDERDEFAIWIGGDLDNHMGPGSVDSDDPPRNRRELVKWLKEPVPHGLSQFSESWRAICGSRLFHCVAALCDLGNEGFWPLERWRHALYSWSDPKLAKRSWPLISRLVLAMPVHVLAETVPSVACWLEAVSETDVDCQRRLLEIWDKIFGLGESLVLAGNGLVQLGTEPVTEAMNGAIGRLTSALVKVWLRQLPRDNEGLPEVFKERFDHLLELGVDGYRQGRIILAVYVIPLFRVDEEWVKERLLKLFDWGRFPEESGAMWQGFLVSPRLFGRLLLSLKENFLEAARHYDDLGEFGKQFAGFLTYAGLESLQGFGVSDFQIAFGKLPEAGLAEAARALWQALDGAGERRSEFWVRRVGPFLKEVWPKAANPTRGISFAFAQLAISAGSRFPEAFELIRRWLMHIPYPGDVYRRLAEAPVDPEFKGSICSRFPKNALLLLDAVTGELEYADDFLRGCLEAIRAADLEQARNPRFVRLHDMLRGVGV